MNNQIKYYRASTRIATIYFSATAVASVARELFRNLLPEQDDSKNKFFSATAVASVARELFRNLLPEQDDSKNKFFLGEAKASVARNFLGIYFLKKGTLK